MSREYFLSPASEKNNRAPYKRLEETVVDGFSASDLERYTNKICETPARIWGFREGNKAFWQRMHRGDVILFYTGDEYRYAGRVQRTERNQDLAEEIWGRLEQSLGGDLIYDFEPWPYLVFLQNLRKLSLQSAHLHELLGYKQNHIVGTTRITDERKGGVKQEYGSMAALIVAHTVKKYWDEENQR